MFASDFDQSTWRAYQGWKPVAEISIYIAGPYTGAVVTNVQRAVRAYHDLADLGFRPYCPHFNMLAEMQRERAYEFWMQEGLHWVRKCDAVYRLPGESPGAEREVALARELGMLVFDDVQALIQWRNTRGVA